MRGVVAESVLAKHQLLILNRSRQRAPNLRPLDRLIAVDIAALPNRFGQQLADRFLESTVMVTTTNSTPCRTLCFRISTDSRQLVIL